MGIVDNIQETVDNTVDEAKDKVDEVVDKARETAEDVTEATGTEKLADTAEDYIQQHTGVDLGGSGGGKNDPDVDNQGSDDKGVSDRDGGTPGTKATGKSSFNNQTGNQPISNKKQKDKNPSNNTEKEKQTDKQLKIKGEMLAGDQTDGLTERQLRKTAPPPANYDGTQYERTGRPDSITQSMEARDEMIQTAFERNPGYTTSEKVERFLKNQGINEKKADDLGNLAGTPVKAASDLAKSVKNAPKVASYIVNNPVEAQEKITSRKIDTTPQNPEKENFQRSAGGVILGTSAVTGPLSAVARGSQGVAGISGITRSSRIVNAGKKAKNRVLGRNGKKEKFRVDVEQGREIDRADSMNTEIRGDNLKNDDALKDSARIEKTLSEGNEDKIENPVKNEGFDSQKAAEVQKIDNKGKTVGIQENQRAVFQSEQPELTGKVKNKETGEIEEIYSGKVSTKGEIQDEKAKGFSKVETFLSNKEGKLGGNREKRIVDFEVESNQLDKQTKLEVRDGDRRQAKEKVESDTAGTVGDTKIRGRSETEQTVDSEVGTSFKSESVSLDQNQNFKIENVDQVKSEKGTQRLSNEGILLEKDFVNQNLEKIIKNDNLPGDTDNSITEEQLRDLQRRAEEIFDDSEVETNEKTEIDEKDFPTNRDENQKTVVKNKDQSEQETINTNQINEVQRESFRQTIRQNIEDRNRIDFNNKNKEDFSEGLTLGTATSQNQKQGQKPILEENQRKRQGKNQKQGQKPILEENQRKRQDTGQTIAQVKEEFYSERPSIREKEVTKTTETTKTSQKTGTRNNRPRERDFDFDFDFNEENNIPQPVNTNEENQKTGTTVKKTILGDLLSANTSEQLYGSATFSIQDLEEGGLRIETIEQKNNEVNL